MSTYRYSSDGKNLAILNSNTLSTAEVNKNGFVATIESQGGAVLNENAVKGQSVTDNHTYKLYKKVDADVSIGSAWFNNRDLTGVTTAERYGLIGAAALDYGTQKISQGASAFAAIRGKGLKGKGGGDMAGGPTNMDSAEWKDYFSRLEKSGNPGSATPAPPASSPITLRPSH